MDQKTVSRYKKLLLDRLAELSDLSEMSATDRAPVELDQQSVGRVSRVDALQQQAMSQAQDRQRQGEIVRIEQALQRIAEDDFGYCIDCGEEIVIGRLSIDPSVSHCVSCAN